MSSSDATPDNSPPNSPPMSYLPPPKAAPRRRQIAARPRKPQAPKGLVLKVKAPVTKRRSAITAQPRRSVPKMEKVYMEKPHMEKSQMEKPHMEKPHMEKPHMEKLHMEKPYTQKPHMEKLQPHVEKPYTERPYTERPYMERLYMERPYTERPYTERPYTERPYTERPYTERPYMERSYMERSYMEGPYMERPYMEKPYMEEEFVERAVMEKPPKVVKERAVNPRRRVPKTGNRVLTSNDLLRLPHQGKTKRIPEPRESTDSDEIDQYFSDEERRRAVQVATERLEELLNVTTTMVHQLQSCEQDIQRLQQEKGRLLDELLVCEGLAVNPYPPFKPALLAKRPKRGRR